MDRIVPFSGIELIRRKPEMYLPGGHVTGGSICACLADDARALGAANVLVDSIDHWHIVAADVDWLLLPKDRQVALDRLFVGMHVHPTRINGIRAEVLVAAFAYAAYVSTPEDTRPVVGDRPLPNAVKHTLRQRGYVRSVAFMLATANNRWSGP